VTVTSTVAVTTSEERISCTALKRAATADRSRWFGRPVLGFTVNLP
jgi:hypothetical protein